MGSPSNPMTRNKRTEWTTARDRILVQVLLDLKRSGRWGDTGPTRDSWRLIVDQLNEKVPSIPTTREQIRNHIFELKRNYSTVKAMRESSGFTWNESTQQVYASDIRWEEYIHTHKDAKRFMRAPFPLYDELDELYRGIVIKSKQSISTKFVSQRIGLRSTPIPPREIQEYDQSKHRSETSSSVRTKRSRTSIDDHSADEVSRLVDGGTASKPRLPNPYGYEACLDEIISMEELTVEERIKLSDLLRDRYHRIAFMKFRADRIAWVRAHLH